MEILEQPRDTIQIKDIGSGRTFVYNNIAYMKVYGSGAVNAVALHSGSLYFIEDTTDVYPVEFVVARK